MKDILNLSFNTSHGQYSLDLQKKILLKVHTFTSLIKTEHVWVILVPEIQQNFKKCCLSKATFSAIISKFCTKSGSINVTLCAIFQNHKATVMDVKNEQYQNLERRWLIFWIILQPPRVHTVRGVTIHRCIGESYRNCQRYANRIVSGWIDSRDISSGGRNQAIKCP